MAAFCVVVFCGCSTSGAGRDVLRTEEPPGKDLSPENGIESAGGHDSTEREPSPRPRPRLIQKLNPIWWIGNADEPEPPDWYRPGQGCRRTRWHLRNPFHNFTFYVIGIADQDFERTGTHPGRVFHPEKGWTRAVSRHRCLRLPFASYINGDFKFYAGWRERGNFGLKLTF